MPRGREPGPPRLSAESESGAASRARHWHGPLLDQIHTHVAEAHPELAKKKPTSEQPKKAIKPKV
jgi:hypothetical protein